MKKKLAVLSIFSVLIFSFNFGPSIYAEEEIPKPIVIPIHK